MQKKQLREKGQIMVGICLTEEERATLEAVTQITPEYSRHRRLVAAMRLGLDELRKRPERVMNYLENRAGRPAKS